MIERKIWKCPFKPSGGLALNSPEGQKNWWVSNNILWQPPCHGMSVSARTVCHTPTKVGRRQRLYRINAEAMRAIKKVWEREREVGRTLTKSPRLLALSASDTLTSSSTKCYWKGKMSNVFKSSLDFSPHAISHCQINMAEPKGHIFEERKTRISPVAL